MQRSTSDESHSVLSASVKHLPFFVFTLIYNLNHEPPDSAWGKNAKT